MSDVPHADNTLDKVHPDLLKVLDATLQVPQAFKVIHGLRTQIEEAKLVAAGHSTTMHSRHLANKQGYCCAVDVVALVNGHITWDASVYPAIAAQVKAASKALNIPVEWGGDWKTFKDLGHFQLPWQQYP